MTPIMVAVVEVNPRRKFVAYLAVLGVVGLTYLPSEHIHSRTEDGRHSEYSHRHFGPHHPVTAHAYLDHHDDEDDARYLSSAFTITKQTPRVPPGNQFVVLAFSLKHPQTQSWRRIPALFVSVHDPPWADSVTLRGPPFSV